MNIRLFAGALALILFSVSSSAQDAQQQQQPTQGDVVACDGEEARLECPEGTVIMITVANYGRFSVKTCPNLENPASGTCYNPESQKVMQTRCNGQSSCSLLATPDAFPGLKSSESCDKPYLQLQYTCMPIETTTTSTTTTTTTTSAATTARAEIAHAAGVSGRDSNRAVDVSTTPAPVQSCITRVHNGVEYPSVRANDIVRRPCMDGAKGESWWQCGADGLWIGTYPNTSHCVSEWTITRRGRLQEIVKQQDAPGLPELMRGLAADTRRPMQAGDLPKLIELLSDVSQLMQKEQWTRSVRTILNDKLVELVNYVTRSSEVWTSWPIEKRRQMASRLLSLMEKMLAWGAPNSEERASSVVYAQPSVTAQISDTFKALRGIAIEYVTLPSTPIWNDLHNQDSVDVPLEALQISGGDDNAKIFFASMSKIAPNLRPLPILRHNAGESGPGEIVEREVVSNIVTASIFFDGKPRRVAMLEKPVFITLVHAPEVVRRRSNPECSWWNEDRLKWSPTGCELRSHNTTHTICACSHLTHFAVLMDVTGLELSPLDNQLLTFLTYFGCSLSIVCLLITFFCFAFFSKGGGDRVFIHKNLCAMLALAELLFLLGIWRTDNKIECSVIAGGLLYLFLSALTWMLLEGYQLYQMLVEVFPSDSRKCLFTFIGYGFPAIVTAVAAYLDPNGFGSKDHCWLRTDNGFILVFIIPAAVIMAVNTVFLLMTMCIVCRHAQGGYLPCRQESDTGANVRSWVKGALSISCLLGITWTLGLLWVDDRSHSVYLAYAFTITNSLQGLAIFMFHIVLSDKMRKDISRWLTRRGCCCMTSSSSDSRRKSGSLPRGGTMSPGGGSGGSATASELMYPSSEKYHTSPRLMQGPPVYGQQALMQEYHQRLAQSQGTYDYATISYGEMLPGNHPHHVFRPPPNYRNPHGRSPDYRAYPGTLYREDLYNHHRPPPEFSPPPPPPGCVSVHDTVPRALVYAARRPPSSKMSDDSAYSEGHSSMLTTEVTPSGATVLRMDLSKNPPLYSQDV